MKTFYIIIAFLFLLFFEVNLFAQKDVKLNTDADITASIWKGFERRDFTYNNRVARLVVPDHPLPGNPWIWRARFPDWHTEADSILISEGFHLAYIDTDNLYGSPKAIKIWNKFYNYLKQEYKLQSKVSLIGVSRGGLFVYNWAKRNPGKVACIYAEAPVCDFKSWPGGLGDSDGSQQDWIKLKDAYGFGSNEEAIDYSNNPIDSLKVLAENNVPILHMVSLEDKIVPVNENTLPLINKYISLGGTATVVPCTKGEQKLQGHHFPVETPRLVADFIKYNTLQYQRLSSSDYHHLGGGLKNARIIFERDKRGRVAFLGGSITYNQGWRDSVMQYLQVRFPATDFEFVAAGIPSMGTTPAAFRLERDVLSKGKIDLLFEEAAVNDAANGRTSTEQIRAMEGIVRHSRISNPFMDIVMFHFVDPAKMESYKKGIEPEVISNHNKVAVHYSIPTINLAKEVTDRINNHEFAWEKDFNDLHPSPFGQGIYANSMIDFLANAFTVKDGREEEMTRHILPEKIDDNCYDNGYLIDINKAQLSEGWSINPMWKPNDGAGTRQNYVNVPMLIGNKEGAIVEIAFEGNAVGIAVASGQDAGIIEYRVDKNDWKRLNLFTKWSNHLHLPWYYTLESQLTNGEHLLEIRMADIPDGSNNEKACRIRYFYVNRI